MLTVDTFEVETAPAGQHDAIDVLLEDPEWLEAEFAAILSASGIDVRLTASTPRGTPQPDMGRPAGTGTPTERPSRRFARTKQHPRTRSPLAR